MKWMQTRGIRLLMAVILLISMAAAARGAAMLVSSTEVKKAQYTVVIDAGHGGSDPGKVGINGALEKDINLEIALSVRDFLEEEDVRVIMTRETAEGLYDKNASNKKVDDMKKRIVIMEKEKPDAVISIHQNSYHEESVSGPQVFYYNGSVEGKKMADIMQAQLIQGMKPEKERVAKENSSYYLLKKTSAPIVIVECGFLSNSREAEYLCTPLYREKMAWNIHLAVLRYLNERKY